MSTRCVGMRWTKYEDDALIAELSKGLSIADIATQHERTVKGITCRVEKVVYDMNKSGKDIDTIMATTKLNKTQVEEAIVNESGRINRSSTDTNQLILDQLRMINQTLNALLIKLSQTS